MLTVFLKPFLIYEIPFQIFQGEVPFLHNYQFSVELNRPIKLLQSAIDLKDIVW